MINSQIFYSYIEMFIIDLKCFYYRQSLICNGIHNKQSYNYVRVNSGKTRITIYVNNHICVFDLKKQRAIVDKNIIIEFKNHTQFVNDIFDNIVTVK